MSPKHQLASLQLAIMQVLWQLREATVAQVHQALREERSLAYTTIATMLSKMERKGQVKHRQEGRVLVYQPVIQQQAVCKSMVADLTRRLFRGDVTQLVSHLLTAQDMSAEELDRLERLIRQHKRNTP